jgi:hypothetical protein
MFFFIEVYWSVVEAFLKILLFLMKASSNIFLIYVQLNRMENRNKDSSSAHFKSKKPVWVFI